jgi:hypothetical protein
VTGDVALADQHQAATADAERIALATAADTDGVVERIAADEWHPWIAAIFDEINDTIAAGRMRMCPHLTNSPQPVYISAWRRDVLLCPHCMIHLCESLTPTDALTCDRCTQHDPSGGLYPITVQNGSALIAFGLCDTCHTDLHLATP